MKKLCFFFLFAFVFVGCPDNKSDEPKQEETTTQDPEITSKNVVPEIIIPKVEIHEHTHFPTSTEPDVAEPTKPEGNEKVNEPEETLPEPINEKVEPEKTDESTKETIICPDWLLEPPIDPDDKAIFATGIYLMKDLSEIQTARSASIALTRNEFVTSLTKLFTKVLNAYGKKIFGTDEKTQYESITEQAIKQLINNQIYGAKVVRQELRKYEDKFLWFTLLKIGFDGVAKGIYSAVKQEFEEIKENPADVIDELYNLLEKELEPNFVLHGVSVLQYKLVKDTDEEPEKPKEDKKEEPKETDKEKIEFPDWFVNPPVDKDEKSILGTGMFAMDDLAEIQFAKHTAIASARIELAASLANLIVNVLAEYDEKIRGADDKSNYRSLTDRKKQDLVRYDIISVTTMKSETRNYKEQILMFTLLKISFDTVAKKLHDIAIKEFAEIDENSKDAFDELDKLLEAELEPNYVLHGSSVPTEQFPKSE